MYGVVIEGLGLNTLFGRSYVDAAYTSAIEVREEMSDVDIISI
jgi:hypothetical protein